MNKGRFAVGRHFGPDLASGLWLLMMVVVLEVVRRGLGHVESGVGRGYVLPPSGTAPGHLVGVALQLGHGHGLGRQGGSGSRFRDVKGFGRAVPSFKLELISTLGNGNVSTGRNAVG